MAGRDRRRCPDRARGVTAAAGGRTEDQIRRFTDFSLCVTTESDDRLDPRPRSWETRAIFDRPAASELAIWSRHALTPNSEILSADDSFSQIVDKTVVGRDDLVEIDLPRQFIRALPLQ